MHTELKKKDNSGKINTRIKGAYYHNEYSNDDRGEGNGGD